MPNERMRALRWGGELLAEIGRDETMPQRLRARGPVLRPVYPTPHALEQLLIEGAMGLPEHWGNALSEAVDLFQEVRLGLHGSEVVRHSLLFTLRHFPQKREIPLNSGRVPLEWWLVPERNA